VAGCHHRIGSLAAVQAEQISALQFDVYQTVFTNRRSGQSVPEANIACAERRYDGASLIQINPATRRRLTLRLRALPSWLRTEHAMRRFCIDKGHCWLIAVRAKTGPGDSIKRMQPSQLTVLKGN
jgi:hypothetical protein